MVSHGWLPPPMDCNCMTLIVDGTDHYTTTTLISASWNLMCQSVNRGTARYFKDILVEPGLHIYKTCTINKLVVYTNII